MGGEFERSVRGVEFERSGRGVGGEWEGSLRGVFSTLALCMCSVRIRDYQVKTLTDSYYQCYR